MKQHLRPSARVLDVGCGDGWLSNHLAEVGMSVHGIDPQAPDGELFTRVGLLEYDPHDRYDAVVAVVSLHHIPDLGAAVARIADLLEADGTFLAVEFGWERWDDRTARWCLERLPLDDDDDHGGWLQHRCAGLRTRLDQGQPLRAAEHFRFWAEEEGLHSSAAMMSELQARFSTQVFEWAPYLYPDLDGVTEADEQAAIDAGEISAIGFRFAGAPLTPLQPG